LAMENYNYPIDYNHYTNEEIIIIIEFLSLIEDANEKKVDKELLLKKHNEFKKTINSISLEKQMDRDFFKVSGYSIYKTIKQYK